MGLILRESYDLGDNILGDKTPKLSTSIFGGFRLWEGPRAEALTLKISQSPLPSHTTARPNKKKT